MYNWLGEHTHLTLELIFITLNIGGKYYAFHMVLLVPEFVAEGMAGQNFCAPCALLIDEINELRQKKGENWSKLLKHIQMWSSK